MLYRASYIYNHNNLCRISVLRLLTKNELLRGGVVVVFLGLDTRVFIDSKFKEMGEPSHCYIIASRRC